MASGFPIVVVLVDTASRITAWATVALVIVGTFSFFVTGFLAWSTKTAAQAALRQADAIYPRLDIEAQQTSAESPQASGNLVYLAGTLPATSIDVWVRGPGATGTLYYRPFSVFSALDSPKAYAATPVPHQRGTLGSKFPTVLNENENRVGVEWTGPDGRRRSQTYTLLDGAQPPPLLGRTVFEVVDRCSEFLVDRALGLPLHLCDPRIAGSIPLADGQRPVAALLEVPELGLHNLVFRLASHRRQRLAEEQVHGDQCPENAETEEPEPFEPVSGEPARFRDPTEETHIWLTRG
jgi:hypothetical protein